MKIIIWKNSHTEKFQVKKKVLKYGSKYCQTEINTCHGTKNVRRNKFVTCREILLCNWYLFPLIYYGNFIGFWLIYCSCSIEIKIIFLTIYSISSLPLWVTDAKQ